jgi:Cu+-exporting ATPase
MVGTGEGSRRGILIKGGAPLQALGKIDTVVFDKTGTLTEGRPIVIGVVSFNKNQSEILQIAATLESASEHSLAAAILNYAKKRKIPLGTADNFRAIPGRGIEATINGKLYRFGNSTFAIESNITNLPKVVKTLERQGKTVSLLFDKEKVLGLIAIADQPKATAKAAVKMLNELGIESYILSGDNRVSAAAIARRLGIKKVIAEVLPAEKSAQIANLQKSGRKVAMVGDGINDAPALARADVAIAMSGGADAAMETGDVVLVGGDPRGVARAVELSRATLGKIHQNLFFSLIYNAAGIPIAAGVFAFAGLTLRPEIAGLAMAMSSVSVVVNSLSLRMMKLKRK